MKDLCKQNLPKQELPQKCRYCKRPASCVLNGHLHCEECATEMFMAYSLREVAKLFH
jgi:hypothetical protein